MFDSFSGFLLVVMWSTIPVFIVSMFLSYQVKISHGCQCKCSTFSYFECMLFYIGQWIDFIRSCCPKAKKSTNVPPVTTYSNWTRHVPDPYAFSTSAGKDIPMGIPDVPDGSDSDSCDVVVPNRG